MYIGIADGMVCCAGIDAPVLQSDRLGESIPSDAQRPCPNGSSCTHTPVHKVEEKHTVMRINFFGYLASDESPLVREAMIRAMGDWLLNLPEREIYVWRLFGIYFQRLFGPFSATFRAIFSATFRAIFLRLFGPFSATFGVIFNGFSGLFSATFRARADGHSADVGLDRNQKGQASEASRAITRLLGVPSRIEPRQPPQRSAVGPLRDI